MIRSLEAGKLLDLPSEETLSDGTAGGVEHDSITFELCQELIQTFSLISETEIAGTLKQFINSHGMLIEGSAAVAIAGLMQRREEFAGQKCSRRFVWSQYRNGRTCQRFNWGIQYSQ